ncbi:MAG: RNA methyltransferase [Alphaproteobacteria bacterium HGW-Alphaproteobacteria-14]|nr:MAG: RNA methyltransferase [Alphaproteobacteria bacterium HGW-Alphaproteobacteria-14]
MRKHITGFSNPTVKYLRSLRDKKHRKRSGQFLVEGLRLLEDARSTGRLPTTLVMAEGRAAHDLLARLEADVVAAGGEVISTTPDILSKITGKDNAQSVVGVFDEWDTSLAALDRSAAPIWLVAQALRDPGNLGTMLRTGDAVGAGGLILIARWEEFLPWLRGGAKQDGGQLVAASLRDAVPYRGAAYAAPCFILVGNESQGLPEEYEAACDLRVTMPMKGRADSLNAAVAAAVLAYEVLAGLGCD